MEEVLHATFLGRLLLGRRSRIFMQLDLGAHLGASEPEKQRQRAVDEPEDRLAVAHLCLHHCSGGSGDGGGGGGGGGGVGGGVGRGAGA
jgi:hypothetical protein